jgi:FAD/FMN-containing dehydrogenase
MALRTPSHHSTANMQWKNLHENVRRTVADYRELWNPMPPQPNTVVADVAATSRYVCSILAEASDKGASVRAVGGAWSLSDVAVSDDIMLGTRNLNLWFPIASGSLHAQNTRPAESLFYMQCGSSVGEVYRRLEQRNYTLPTSGASNGQTIAGAVSTGTHGSAFAYGSIQECVVAIHLVVGPNPDTDVLLLERASDPVIHASLAQRLGATLVRNDALFDAALVAFGAMGFVMGYVVEATPLYHLEAWRRLVPYNDDLRRLMTTMDVDIIQRLVPSIPVHADRVWHVEVTLNPHDQTTAHLTVMERWSTHRRLSPVEPHASMTPGDDVLSMLGSITQNASWTVSQATKALLQTLAADRGPVVATPYGTFTAGTVRGSVLSVEMGVPMERSVDALNVLMNCRPTVDRLAGVLACRWVKASRASLAFTQFPVTCTIEIPGMANTNTLAYYGAAYAALFASGIPTTAHWGQIFPVGQDILRAYGGKVQQWLDARAQLLSSDMQKVFDHPTVPLDIVAGR